MSWKLCLNLCSLRWLKPSLSLVISLIPLGLQISKIEFGEGRMKLSIFSLKTGILLEFLRLVIPFNNSWRKKIIFEKVMLCLNKGNIASSERICGKGNIRNSSLPHTLKCPSIFNCWYCGCPMRWRYTLTLSLSLVFPFLSLQYIPPYMCHRLRHI